MNSTSKIETYFHAFREISTLIHSSDDITKVMELVVCRVSEALGAQGALLRILNQNQEFELGASCGISEAYLKKGPVVQKKNITDLYENKKVVIIENVLNDPRVQYPHEVRKEGADMIMDLPLFSHGKMLGLLRIFFDKQRKFKKNEIDFAIALAEQSSCAIDKARLIEDQKHKYDELALHTEKLSALGRMAAGIAHEINNPLGGILLFSSNLFKKAPEKTPLKEGLEIIIGETQRCKIIIQELLEFARDKVPEKKTADINEIINNSLNILENEFRLRHIKINADLLHDIKKCLVDDNQIRQVFVNLLLNAAHAIDNNGAISIKTKMDCSGEAVVMNIEDNGCGIPDDNLKKIFEPFFSTKKNGSGLGLAVSYSIIRNHHGTINVKSQVGKGSTFTITLPIKGDGT